MSADVGVALGPDRIVAMKGARRAFGAAMRWEVWSRDLDEAAAGDDLREALADLRTEFGAAGGLHVALLPPYSQSRLLELPRLTPSELRAVVSRSADRYFPGVAESQIAGAVSLGKNRRGVGPVFAAIAPARMVEALLGAARETGWESPTVISGVSSWAEGALRVWPQLRRKPASLILLDDSMAHVLTIDGGRVTGVRRMRPGALEYTVVPIGRMVVIVGAGDRAASLRDECLAAGLDVMPSSADGSVTPAVLAALGAARGVEPEILPPRAYQERATRARRLTRRLVGAAAGVALVAAGLHLWGLHREIAAVERERSSIRARVQVALGEREVLGGLQTRLQALGALEASAPRWSGVIAGVAAHLPLDAHLRTLRAAGDSLVLEGDATRAVGVFEALQRAQVLRSVRATGPIQQAQGDGEDAAKVERFTLGARLGGGSPQ